MRSIVSVAPTYFKTTHNKQSRACVHGNVIGFSSSNFTERRIADKRGSLLRIVSTSVLYTSVRYPGWLCTALMPDNTSKCTVPTGTLPHGRHLQTWNESKDLDLNNSPQYSGGDKHRFSKTTWEYTHRWTKIISRRCVTCDGRDIL